MKKKLTLKDFMNYAKTSQCKSTITKMVASALEYYCLEFANSGDDHIVHSFDEIVKGIVKTKIFNSNENNLLQLSSDVENGIDFLDYLIEDEINKQFFYYYNKYCGN